MEKVALAPYGNSRRDIIIKNCFFLWSQALILLLTLIPLVSHAFKKHYAEEWFVPKVYELKMYAVAMLVCAALPLLSRFSRYGSLLLENEHARYQRFLLIFYPLAVICYAMIQHEHTRYLCVFLLSLVGMGILIYDLWRSDLIRSIDKNYYNYFLIASLTLSIFIIACKTGSLFNLVSVVSLGIFVCLFFVLRLVNFHHKYLLLLLPIFLFMVTFLSSSGASVLHYGFFLGPAMEVIYGHQHPLDLNIQYGSGLTSFFALYFKLKGSVSIEGMREFLRVLAFTAYFLIFFIAASIYRSYKIAALALLAILFFNFYSQIDKYYTCPSGGFIRFGFIYFVLSIYLLEGKRLLSQKTTFFLVAIIASLGCIWSFESAFYTLPTVFFVEFINKTLKKFLPIFLICFSIILLAYLSPYFLDREWPSIDRFYEYAMVYAGGFNQVPFSRATNFWWLFPLLYGFMLLKITSGDISNKIVVGLTIYGICLFTYYGGRADPNNLFHVSIPFILLSIYLILNLQSVTLLAKQILLALALTTFLSVNYQWTEESGKMVMKQIWVRNLPLVLNHFLPLSAQIQITQPPPKFDDIVQSDCSIYAPLEKYIENGTIALLNEEDHFYLFYACTHTHNALAVNPYKEISLNSKAINRTIIKAASIPNQYLLIESSLLQRMTNDEHGSRMTADILKTKKYKKIGEVKLPDSTFVIFHT